MINTISELQSWTGYCASYGEIMPLRTLILILLGFIATMLIVTVVSAQSTTIGFDPADPIEVCTEPVTVEIHINDVTNLYGYEFRVLYDPDVLLPDGDFIDTWYDSSSGFKPNGWRGDCINGACQFAVTLLQPDPPVNGSGPIASITMTAVGSGTSDLTITDVILADPDGFSIPTTVANTVTATSCIPTAVTLSNFSSAPSSGTLELQLLSTAALCLSILTGYAVRKHYCAHHD